MQQRGITHGNQDVQINADLDSNYHTASKSTGFLAKLCQYSFCLLFSKTGLLFFVLIFGQEHVSRSEVRDCGKLIQSLKERGI